MREDEWVDDWTLWKFSADLPCALQMLIRSEEGEILKMETAKEVLMGRLVLELQKIYESKQVVKEIVFQEWKTM